MEQNVIGGELLRMLSDLKSILIILSPSELKVFSYIWDNISIGEIIIEHDLRKLHGISNSAEILKKLQELELVERGEGCYNLAKKLREIRRKIKSSYELYRVLERLP